MAVAEYLVANRKDAGMPGPQGPSGPAGVTSARGETLPPGSEVEVELHDRVLTVRVPRGDKGETGDAATVTVGDVTTGEPGSDAAVSNSGDEHHAVLDFTLPRGVKGDKGDTATVKVGTVTTGEPGSQASVTNSGTDTDAVWDITIPRGDKGENTAAIGSVTASVDNTSGTPNVTVTAGGTPTDRTLDFRFTGLKGDGNVSHDDTLTGDGTSGTPLGVAETIARKTDIPSDYVSDSELAAKLRNYVTTSSLSSTLNGYATDTELSQGLQSEASEREKQDGLLEEAISGKISPSNVKAGAGIATRVSGNDVTVSASPATINVTFAASLFSAGSLSARKSVSGLGSVNLVCPKATATNIQACRDSQPWLADHSDDSGIPAGQLQCTVSSVPTSDLEFVVTVLKG